MKNKFLILILGVILFISPIYVFAEDEENQPNDPNTQIPTVGNNENEENTGKTNEENTGETNENKTEEEKPVVMTLAELNVAGGKLSPAFNPTTYKYTITVSDPNAFKISFKQNDDRVSIIADWANATDQLKEILKKAGKKVTIVLAYDGLEPNGYELTLDYEEPVISTYLNSLQVVGYAFKPRFNKTVQQYELEMPIPNSLSSVTIKASAEDKENVEIITNFNNNSIKYNSDGMIVKNLKVGNNKIEVVVKNDTDSRTYTLNVMRSSEEVETVEDNTEEKKPDEEEKENVEEENKKEEIKEEKEEKITPKKDVPDANPILNRIIVTVASLIGIALGGFGIYFYIKTSPKKMKKEILELRDKHIDDSPVVEVEENKKEMLDETKEFVIGDNNKDA